MNNLLSIKYIIKKWKKDNRYIAIIFLLMFLFLIQKQITCKNYKEWENVIQDVLKILFDK